MTGQKTNRAMLITPPGAGAIGVIRVAGPGVLSIVDQIFQSPRGITLTQAKIDRVYYGNLTIDNEIIDDVVINRNGLNREPSVDICSHGGVRIIERILLALASRGVSVESAVDHSWPVWTASNLIEREADELMMQAKTIRAAQFLAHQRELLPKTIRVIGSLIDEDPDNAFEKLFELSQGYSYACKLIKGVTIAIVGPPNSGKSTLFNQFIGRSATVVSPRAGTTRDWVKEEIEFQGLAVALVDTAGRHDEAECLEHLAIELGLQKSKDADLQLLVLDGSTTLSTGIRRMLENQLDAGSTIVILNKQDLTDLDQGLGIKDIPCDFPVVSISAKMGTGLHELIQAILSALGLSNLDEDPPCIFSLRQKKITDRMVDAQITRNAVLSDNMIAQLLG